MTSVQIVPEYTIDYYDEVIKQQLANLSRSQHGDLESIFEYSFFDGMHKYQQQLSLKWMKYVFFASGLTQGQASEELGIQRTRLNRWLSGEIDPPFIQFQKFYTYFGGLHKDDHPFEQHQVLNLGGYLNSIVYVRAFLEKCGLAKAKRAPAKLPNLEVFLGLNYFYSSVEPGRLIDSNQQTEGEVVKIFNQIRSAFHENFKDFQLKNPKELAIALDYWALPWLHCLTLIADAGQGIENFRVIARNKPVLLKS